MGLPPSDRPRRVALRRQRPVECGDGELVSRSTARHDRRQNTFLTRDDDKAPTANASYVRDSCRGSGDLRVAPS